MEGISVQLLSLSIKGFCASFYLAFPNLYFNFRGILMIKFSLTSPYDTSL